MKSQINVNQIMTSIIIGLLSWISSSVYEMSKSMAAFTTRIEQHDKQFVKNDERFTKHHERLSAVELWRAQVGAVLDRRRN